MDNRSEVFEDEEKNMAVVLREANAFLALLDKLIDVESAEFHSCWNVLMILTCDALQCRSGSG